MDWGLDLGRPETGQPSTSHAGPAAEALMDAPAVDTLTVALNHRPLNGSAASAVDVANVAREAAPQGAATTPPHALPGMLGFAARSYRQMDVSVDPAQRAAWVRFNSRHSPSFTHDLLDDLLDFRRALTTLFASEGHAGANRGGMDRGGMDRGGMDRGGAGRPGAARHDAGIDFVVSASRMRGVYNLGGDLPHFADCIRAGDREALRAYAHKCCEMIWHGYTAFRLPVVLVGLIEGDALGGGFECALSCGVLVAERRARFGMPEVLFNMFPGMGAYSLLSRRIGGAKAMEMILSGRIYTAEEMHALGIVDVLAEDGEGAAAVGDYMRRNARKVSTLCALQDVRRRVDGLTLQELLDVTDRWVEQAMGLDDASLRRMEKLRAAQGRRSLAPDAARAGAESQLEA
jgi:DSF synthase